MQVIKRFMQQESAAAWLLVSCALIAFFFSNSPWHEHYTAWLHDPLEFQFRGYQFTLNLRLIINEGLMTAFFLVVGIEMKYELLAGALNTRAKATLPAIAAVGGMLIPALIFVTCVHASHTQLRGWAIPTATDIAFSLGILNLLARRVTTALKIFLTTLAIFDDLAAIMIIAFFYSSHIAFLYLGIAALLLGLIHILTRLQVQLIVPYWLLGGLLWLCLFKAGVHPTLSGILLAFTLPLAHHANAPAEQFKQSLHPWVPMLILPLFAFANAGVPLHDVHTMPFPLTLFFGCMLGLVLGKPIGVLVFSWLAVRLRIGSLPATVQWREFIGMACLCGIGFTISLFIANLAFDSSQADLNAAKLGTLFGSLISGVLGYWWLRRQPRQLSA